MPVTMNAHNKCSKKEKEPVPAAPVEVSYTQTVEKHCPEITGLNRRIHELWKGSDFCYFRVNWHDPNHPKGNQIAKSAFVRASYDGTAQVELEKPVFLKKD